MKNVKKTRHLLVLVAVFCHAQLMAEVLTDPTMPPGHRSLLNQSVGINTAPKFVLSSTLISPTRRLATINGKTLGVGQTIAGARIVSIEPTRVALLDGDKKVVLILLPKKVKRNY